jgi:hypothetical protein
MGARRIRRELFQIDQKRSRLENGIRKVAERERRRKRMITLIKAGTFPYTPAIQSWLSAEIGRPMRQIQPADVQNLIG